MVGDEAENITDSKQMTEYLNCLNAHQALALYRLPCLFPGSVIAKGVNVGYGVRSYAAGFLDSQSRYSFTAKKG